MRRNLLLSTSILGALLFGAIAYGCSPRFENLPQGEQVLTGELRPAELRLVRRGTHVLVVNGKERAYVESRSGSLRRFENRTVLVRGVFEQNTDPSDLPVLVVSEVLDTENPVAARSFPSLSLELSTPSAWRATETGKTVTFHIEGQSGSVLRIERGNFPSQNGTPVVVDTLRAERTTDEMSGEEKILVFLDDGNMLFTFIPPLGDSAVALREEWISILHSAKFQKNAIQRSSSGTGSTVSSQQTVGKPCGGPAGILCVAGEYCEITDVADNIGRCRKIGGGE